MDFEYLVGYVHFFTDTKHLTQIQASESSKSISICSLSSSQ